MAFASGGVQKVAQTVADYGGSSFWFGSSFTAAAGVRTTHDVLIGKTCQLFSGSYHVSGATRGDTIEFEVVDVDGLLGTPGVVLTQYVDNLYVVDEERRTLSSGQAAELSAGLYLRVVYYSTGQQSVTVSLDWQVFR